MHSLAIDDEFVALAKMVAMLRPHGSCDAATSAGQGFDLFCKALHQGCPYRLVTIDINMPDANGLRLLVRLSREEQRHGAPRARKLIVTADSSEPNVWAALTGECDGFLVKPVRQAILLAKLSSLGLLPPAVLHHPERGPQETEDLTASE